MTEIQEMAQAIHEKHKALWPLTWAVADFMAKQLAGDQGYLIVNQLTHELMGLNTEPVEPAPAQDERVAFEDWCNCDLSRTTPDGPYRYSPASTYWRAWQARAELANRATHPAQTEQQPVEQWQVRYLPGQKVEERWWQDSTAERAAWCAEANAQQLAKGLPDVWEIRKFYAAPIAQTAPQPEQSGSLNMEPEGANAYLVVDPEDNYHVCYVVRSKDQALQHASDGLLAFGPITQGNDSWPLLK